MQAFREKILKLDPATRRQVIESLEPEELEILAFDWWLLARDNQLFPAGDTWTVWLILAGRGWGKSRTANEGAKHVIETGQAGRIALVGPTASDVRDVIIEGESGLLNIFPKHFRPKYEPSKRRLTWPNGAIATAYSADEPERLRGPQHDFALCDELCSWRYPEAYDMLNFGLRLGRDRGVIPRKIISTTPKPTPLIKKIAQDLRTVITRGSTYENRDNLAEQFLVEIKSKYEGTRLGRQELYAEILDDNPGALWQRSVIENNRVVAGQGQHIDVVIRKLLKTMRRIVVGVDPATTSGEDSDETGIVVCGLGHDGFGYVFNDVSIKGTPNDWATRVVGAYRDYGADRVVIEVNQGGDMVAGTIRTVDNSVAIKNVHASKGKLARAEPVAALYEQGRIKHVGCFPKLEDQMCEYEPNTAKKSPDRMDALVWAFTELMIDKNNLGIIDHMANQYQDKIKASGEQLGTLQKELEAKRAKLQTIFRPKIKDKED